MRNAARLLATLFILCTACDGAAELTAAPEMMAAGAMAVRTSGAAGASSLNDSTDATPINPGPTAPPPAPGNWTPTPVPPSAGQGGQGGSVAPVSTAVTAGSAAGAGGMAAPAVWDPSVRFCALDGGPEIGCADYPSLEWSSSDGVHWYTCTTPDLTLYPILGEPCRVTNFGTVIPGTIFGANFFPQH
jgi:hypothetical protein